jgi:hypothetical protein
MVGAAAPPCRLPLLHPPPSAILTVAAPTSWNELAVRLPSLPHRRHHLTAALVVLLVTLVLTASATVASGDVNVRVGASVGSSVGSAAPVRTVVTSGPMAAMPSLVTTQLRDQRAQQLQSLFTTMLQTQTDSPVTAEVDPRIDAPSCALLGRQWTAGGCSRQTCVTGHEYAKTGANAETCRIGGRRGASYGVEVDFRRCQALDRVWIGLLNYCASDPHRTESVVPDAPQCTAPFTSYVLMSETDGSYDECMLPERVAELQRVAARDGKTLAEVAAQRSATQCAWRAGHVYDGRRCHEAPTLAPQVSENVVVVGDSITWRGTNELATLEPDWVIDGSSGRQVDALDERLAAYRSAYGEPGGVVFALGTNGRSGWTEQQFRAGVAALPATTPLLLVTPFREVGTTGRPEMMEHYAAWMHRLAADRPLTCVADWRSAAERDSRLLIDGVHPTSVGEVFWAELVDSSWSSCLARNGLSSS